MLGDKISKLRKERGWTQKKLAATARLSEDYISAIERGKVYPATKTLVILAKCLDVSVELLIDDSPER